MSKRTVDASLNEPTLRAQADSGDLAAGTRLRVGARALIVLMMDDAGSRTMLLSQTPSSEAVDAAHPDDREAGCVSNLTRACLARDGQDES